MIAQKNESILNAANTIWKLTQEERIRQQCEAREDYRRRQLDIQYRFDMLNKQLEQQAQQLNQQTEQLNRQTEQLNQQALTLVGQIRIFLEENYPPEKCATMLMADIAVVRAVYAKIQGSPDMDDASVLESLKGDGLM